MQEHLPKQGDKRLQAAHYLNIEEKQNMWLQVVRYYTAILILFGVPVGLLMWLVIHPFHKLLRHVGLVWAYLIVAVPLTLLAGTILWFRDVMLATDYGTNYLLMALSVAPFALAVTIYLSHRKYLTLPIVVGVPELTGGQKGVLLTEGIYSRIRHPRYVESVLWILGYASSPITWPCTWSSCSHCRLCISLSYLRRRS